MHVFAGGVVVPGSARQMCVQVLRLNPWSSVLVLSPYRSHGRGLGAPRQDSAYVMRNYKVRSAIRTQHLSTYWVSKTASGAFWGRLSGAENMLVGRWEANARAPRSFCVT